jgi:hypothetical protein
MLANLHAALQLAPHGGASLLDATLHRQHADGHATFRAPFGSKLSAWFEVRGEDVLAWVENHGTTTATGRLSLTLGGVERVAHESVAVGPRTRAALWPQRASGGEWPLSARSVSPPLVPPVRPGVSQTYLSWLPQTYTPMMRGMYEEAMGTAGSHGGLLNPWDMAYLASGDPRALRSVVLHGLAAGRYSIHHRDAATHDVLSFAANPHLSNNASSRGQLIPAVPTANRWAISHHPSVGYLAYLLTGWEFFADEVRFAAANNHFSQDDRTRQFAAGIYRTDAGANTPRGAAWALRTLLHAALISPPGSQYEQALKANVKYYFDTYAAPGASPFGMARPYSDYTGDDDELHHALWMEDFLTIALCWIAMARPDDQQARALAHWKSKSIVGRLGDPADPAAFDYRDAAVYEQTIAPGDLNEVRFANPTSGPWYATWGDMWRAVTKGRYSRVDDGRLRGSSASAPVRASQYWGIVAAAAAMAAHVRAPGADAALSRLTGAANWPAIEADFRNLPVWAVSPPERTAMPTPKITVYVEGTEEEVQLEVVRSAPPVDQSSEIAALTAQRDALQADNAALTTQVSTVTADRDALHEKLVAARAEADDVVREAAEARQALGND